MINEREFDRHSLLAQRQPNGSYINKYNTIKWYNDKGQRHNDEGPAITYTNGDTCWYINGERYSFKEWLKLTPITDEQKLLLRLQYGY
jgi:hypothetical protein